MPNRTGLNLDVDLQRGVVPISKAASSLAALIKRADSTGQPVIVTQKGYPTGVLLPIKLFAALKGLADDRDGHEPQIDDEIMDVLGEEVAAPEAEEEAPPEVPKPQRRRKRTEVVA